MSTNAYLPDWSLPAESAEISYKPKKHTKHIDPRVHVKKNGAGKHNWGDNKLEIRDSLYSFYSNTELDHEILSPYTCHERTMDEYLTEYEYALYLSVNHPQPVQQQ
ncbi:hypothetical protein BC833DRAFT_589270 [Globomyces pollinis-pini]|nr:hypothetical protein BC833DRAFT_589270 [Globomyces pollinis-pini]